MANEEQKDFNAILRDCKDMPKIQIITDKKALRNISPDWPERILQNRILNP